VYQQYFGFAEAPFSIAPDPRYLFLSQRHQEALAHLLYGVNGNGGFVLLTGDVGAGKTTVCRCLLEQIPPSCDVAYIFNPKLTVEELLSTICSEFSIPCAPGNNSIKVFVDCINAYLLAAHARDRHTVLIIDEAQNLSAEVLEQMRLLTNLETNQRKLLQIILIGQPELRELLDRVELRQLAQRITGRYHLDPLSDDESAAYVRHRLRVAGATREILSNGALREVQRLSGGVPRLINIISDRALLGAFTEDRHLVSASVVRRAAGEVFGKHIQPRWLPWAAGSAVAALAVVSAVLILPRLRANLPAEPVAALVAPPPAPAPAPPPPGLDQLLGQYVGETDPDNAFNKLFALWGQRYVAGQVDPCSQALQAGLECLTQRGSLAQLRLFNRPAILNIIDSSGKAHQLVLVGLDEEKARVDLGGGQREIGIGDLSRAWFGDYVLLWAPGTGGSQPLGLGARSARVRWLRDSLRRVNGLPVDEAGNDRFDTELAAQVEDFQRKHRLAVDGIAGVQTQVALDAATNDTTTPFLSADRGS
jgi:general secretion pathway protein A